MRRVVEFADLDCSPEIADKLAFKHGIELSEVAEALANDTLVLTARRGLHYVLGRSDAGRYLLVVARNLGGGRCQVVTARDMEDWERRLYRRR